MSAVTIRHPLDLVPKERPTIPANGMLCGLPVGQWDNPVLVQIAARKMPVPRQPINHEVAKTHYLLLKRKQRKIEALRAQLGVEEGLALDMQTDSMRFQRKIQAYRALPINGFPVEILSHIFHTVCESHVDGLGMDRQRMVLSWVCRRWREVALNDALLWRTLWFIGLPPWDTTFLAMGRAGTAPLHVRIHEPVKRKETDPLLPLLTLKNITYLMEHLQSKSSQITYLSMDLERTEVMACALRLLSTLGPAENLRGLDLNLRPLKHTEESLNSTSYVRYPLCSGSYTPKLDRLAIRGLSCQWETFRAPELTMLDLSRLGHLHAPNTPAFRNILTGCPKLRRLVLSCAGPCTPMADYGPPVDLPNLLELLLADMSTVHATFTLSQFNAPNLRSLVMMPMKEELTPLINWIVSTGRYKKVQDLALLVLSFRDSPETKAALVRWFDSMPLLRLLKVSSIGVTVFSALLEDPRVYRTQLDDMVDDNASYEALCPKLWAMNMDQQDVQETAQFIKSRAQLGVPFRRLFLSVRYHVSLTQEQKQQYLEVHPGPWYLNGTFSGAITEEDHEEALMFEEAEKQLSKS